MTLIKYCKPEHNLLNGCRTIRFGTLEYYREMDSSFAIADATEGQESVVINDLDTSTASANTLNTIKPVFGQSLRYVKLKNLILQKTFPNCFIWCCSRDLGEHTEEFGQRFDAEYRSSYRIPDGNRFVELLISLLMSNVTRADFAQASHDTIDRMTVADWKQVQLRWFHNDVVYVDEKASTITNGELESYANSLPSDVLPLFVKPKRYEDDREHRFVFIFYHPQYGVLPVRKNPFDVSTLPITD